MNDDTGLTLRSIGTVCRTAAGVHLKIAADYRPALHGLGDFSHVIVLWWPDQLDASWASELQTEPPYAPGHVMGVFATRAPYRPNPVALTVCPIQSVDEEAGIVRLGEIDALDGSPIFDLKAYFPVCDRVQTARIPEWLGDWPEWLPAEGLTL